MIAGPLLVRPLPMEGESLRGYLLYLGELNGLGSLLLEEVLRTGLRRYRSYKAAVAALSGLEISQLPKIWWQEERHASRSPWTYGIALPSSEVRHVQCSICPRCLQVQSRARAEWEISVFCVCPDHACHLIDVCPGCSKGISWHRPGVRKCACGFDLANSSSTAAAPEVVALSALLSDRLRGFASTDTHGALGFHRTLKRMDVRAMVGTVEILKMLPSPLCALLSPRSSDDHISERLARQTWAQTSAAHNLAHWPKNINLALQHSAKETSGGEGKVCDIHIIKWPHALFRLAPSKEKAERIGLPMLLRDEVDRFIKRQSVTARGKTYFLLCKRPPPRKAAWGHTCFNDRSQTIRDHFLVSNAAMAHAFGVSIPRLETLVKAGLAPNNTKPVRAGELDSSMRRLFYCAVGRTWGYRRLQDLLARGDSDARGLRRAVEELSGGKFGASDPARKKK